MPPYGARNSVLIDCGDYAFGNLGDAAMLQVTVARLRELWPEADLHVLTQDPERLVALVPEARPVPWSGREVWLSNQELLGRAFGRLSGRARGRLTATIHRVRRRWPGLYARVLTRKRQLRAQDTQALEQFLDAFERAAAVVVCGAGGVTDHADRWARPVLALLEMAADRGVPTAVFGHGLGPLSAPELRARAGEVLPRLDLLALRESRFGPAIAQALGVSAERVKVTGDDAIELAFAALPQRLGSSLGINLRLSASSGAGDSHVRTVGPVLRELAARWNARLQPVAISKVTRLRAGRNDVPDAAVNRSLLAGVDDASDGGESATTPGDAILAVGRCRVMVTGAYHAAVFALAQGVPVVALASSRYFEEKLAGLAHMFGNGCRILRLDDPNLSSRLMTEVVLAWEQAPSMRETLLERALDQISSSRAAYRHFVELARVTGPTRGDIRRSPGPVPGPRPDPIEGDYGRSVV